MHIGVYLNHAGRVGATFQLQVGDTLIPYRLSVADARTLRDQLNARLAEHARQAQELLKYQTYS